MISTTLSSSSVASMRAFGSSKSISSFARDIMAAPRVAEIASTAAMARKTRCRARAASIFQTLTEFSSSIAPPPLPTPAPVPTSSSVASISSSSSTKSFKSFAKELAITRRLGDLNVAGQQARTCRGRRSRAATFGRSMVSLVPSPASSLPPVPLSASTFSFGRRRLVDRPMVAKTAMGAPERQRRLFSGTAPAVYATLGAQEQLAMRTALLGKPVEKPKGVQKLLNVLKRS
ncbi:hypothetical protein AURDEDRAFT_162984 [Auricularia subglabra TFB-10046 SS5]|nr:hypothetical protein AURDEDRAFT_162984 [Auricularia subglabra TFB-10046 SS5]